VNWSGTPKPDRMAAVNEHLLSGNKLVAGTGETDCPASEAILVHNNIRQNTTYEEIAKCLNH
jgi:hypothetical protein